MRLNPPPLPPFDAETSELIRELIRAYVPEFPSHRVMGMLAVEWGWLPASWQIGGTLLLHPDGRTGLMTDGPPHLDTPHGVARLIAERPPYTLVEENDPIWRIAAQLYAVRRHPELRSILPQ